MPYFSDEEDNDEDKDPNGMSIEINSLHKEKLDKEMEESLVDESSLSDIEVYETENAYEVQQELAKLFSESNASSRLETTSPSATSISLFSTECNAPLLTSSSSHKISNNACLPFALKHPRTHMRVNLQPESAMCSPRMNEHYKSTGSRTTKTTNIPNLRNDAYIEKDISEVELIDNRKSSEDTESQLPSIAMTFS